MKLETTQKILELKKLFEQLDQIETAISQLLEGGSTPAIVTEKLENKKSKKLSKYLQKKKEMEKNKSEYNFEEFKGKRKPPTCSKCGEVGHRSHVCPKGKENGVVTNSKGDKKVDVEEAVENGALTRLEYTMVRDRKHQEMNSSEVADSMDVDEDEVRWAFSSLTYDGYLMLRK